MSDVAPRATRQSRRVEYQQQSDDDDDDSPSADISSPSPRFQDSTSSSTCLSVSISPRKPCGELSEQDEKKVEAFAVTRRCLEPWATTPKVMAIRSQRTTGGSTAPRESQIPTRMSPKSLNRYIDRSPSEAACPTQSRHSSQRSGPLCLVLTKTPSPNSTTETDRICQGRSPTLTPESLQTTRNPRNLATLGIEDGSRSLGKLSGSIGRRDDIGGCCGRSHASQRLDPLLARHQLNRINDGNDIQQAHVHPDLLRKQYRTPIHNQARHEQEENPMHITTWTSKLETLYSRPLTMESSLLAIDQQMTTTKEVMSQARNTNTLSLTRPSAVTCPSCTFQDSSVIANTLSTPEDYSAHIRSMSMKLSWSPSTSAWSQAVIHPLLHAQLHRNITKSIMPTPPESTPTPTLLVSPKLLIDPKLLASPDNLVVGKSLDHPLQHAGPQKACVPVYHASQGPMLVPDIQNRRQRQAHPNRGMLPYNPSLMRHLRGSLSAKTTTIGNKKDPCSILDLGENEVDRLSPLLDDLVISSPVSLSSFSHDDLSDNDTGYETPMTSPEPSPVRHFSRSPVPFRHDSALAPLDGSHDIISHRQATKELYSSAGDIAFDCDAYDPVKEPSSMLTNTPTRPTDRTDRLGTMTADALHTVAATMSDIEDTILLTTASPANATRSFHSPRQASITRGQFTVTQRQPSALMRFCQRSLTDRRRQVLAGSPDRFVPARGNTPNKELFMLSIGENKLNPASHQSGRSDEEADPFGPSRRRSMRITEALSTVRHPAPPSRPNPRNGTSLVNPSVPRISSEGAVWSVGGRMVTEGVASTPNGRGGRVTSGTNAPHYTADFLRRPTTSEKEACHGQRLAVAMSINQKTRMMKHVALDSPSSSSPSSAASTTWRHGGWERETPVSLASRADSAKPKEVPIIPFRVLDAPALRDDYYCSLLAYCPTIQCLAVGLGSHVYLWSEARGSRHPNIPESLTAPYSSHVTSLSFSSREGSRAILAIGRADGKITLWSPLDHDPRFDSEQPAPISCVCFRPQPVPRRSTREPGMTIAAETLLVGDEVGDVYFYSVEWPTQDQRDLFDWHGSMTLLARISCHTQQVCGLAWSSDGDLFATGGNDNQMFLFESKKLFSSASVKNRRKKVDSVGVRSVGSNTTNGAGLTSGQEHVLNILLGQQRHIFTLNAAVKAIAFAPWQKSLIAAGGGSNDRCIHFFHATSRTSLATIDCHAQVTSLLWSERRKEIAATFGFAQPEHPYRVAVFSWPSCRMVVGIPWWSEERALYAISYPRGPSGGTSDRTMESSRADTAGRPRYGRRTHEEGCLVVATSDASIKFHEIWADGRYESGGKQGPRGVFGGSQILEGECSDEVMRCSAIR